MEDYEEDFQSHDAVRRNLTTIAMFCSLFTLLANGYVIYNVYVAYGNLKTHEDKTKKKLFKQSGCLVTLIMLISLIIAIFNFYIDYYAAGDLLINLVVCSAIVLNFYQDKEKISLFFYKRFIQPLTV